LPSLGHAFYLDVTLSASDVSIDRWVEQVRSHLTSECLLIVDNAHLAPAAVGRFLEVMLDMDSSHPLLLVITRSRQRRGSRQPEFFGYFSDGSSLDLRTYSLLSTISHGYYNHYQQQDGARFVSPESDFGSEEELQRWLVSRVGMDLMCLRDTMEQWWKQGGRLSDVEPEAAIDAAVNRYLGESFVSALEPIAILRDLEVVVPQAYIDTLPTDSVFELRRQGYLATSFSARYGRMYWLAVHATTAAHIVAARMRERFGSKWKGAVEEERYRVLIDVLTSNRRMAPTILTAIEDEADLRTRIIGSEIWTGLASDASLDLLDAISIATHWEASVPNAGQEWLRQLLHDRPGLVEAMYHQASPQALSRLYKQCLGLELDLTTQIFAPFHVAELLMRVRSFVGWQSWLRRRRQGSSPWCDLPADQRKEIASLVDGPALAEVIVNAGGASRMLLLRDMAAMAPVVASTALEVIGSTRYGEMICGHGSVPLTEGLRIIRTVRLEGFLDALVATHGDRMADQLVDASVGAIRWSVWALGRRAHRVIERLSPSTIANKLEEEGATLSLLLRLLSELRPHYRQLVADELSQSYIVNCLATGRLQSIANALRWHFNLFVRFYDEYASTVLADRLSQSGAGEALKLVHGLCYTPDRLRLVRDVCDLLRIGDETVATERLQAIRPEVSRLLEAHGMEDELNEWVGWTAGARVRPKE
jgi:hypothetical protein